MYSIFDTMFLVWSKSINKKTPKMMKIPTDPKPLIILREPPSIFMWNPANVASWGRRAMIRPFQAGLRAVFICLAL